MYGTTDRCPTAQGLEVADVLMLASICAGPHGDPLPGVAVTSLPPRYRHARMLAASWVEEWRTACGGGDGAG
jgi:hypothetical protein